MIQCKTCTNKECNFQHNGTDYVCQNGYAMTSGDKQRILREADAEIKKGN